MKITRRWATKKIEYIQKHITKWQDKKLLKSFLLDVSDKEISFKLTLKTILQNQLHYFNNESQSIKGKNFFNNKKLFLTIVKKIFVELKPLFEIVGVQPLLGPVGLVYQLEYKQCADSDSISLEIVSKAIQAYSRKLQMAWSPEAMQDIKPTHDFDLEEEISAIFAAEISVEIINEVLADLVNVVKDKDPFCIPLSTPTLSQDNAILCTLTRASSRIAKDTRRGIGNIIVTNPTGIAQLQQLSTHITFVPNEVHSYGNLVHAGNLVYSDGRKAWEVYVSTLCNAINDIQYLIAYKGGNGEVDTPYVYSPYIPLLSSGVVVNPDTFLPLVKFMTRYGKHISENAKNYYCIINKPKEVLNEETV